MGNVYASSLLTIIAADGEDANSGLPGMSKLRQQAQAAVENKLPGTNDSIDLITALKPTGSPLDNLTRETIWGSRGWTLQERAMACRTVTFLNEHILWACSTSNWSEETNDESLLARMSWHNLRDSEFTLRSTLKSITAFDNDTDQLWLRFSNLVKNYSQRTLGFESDAYNAFSAIVQQAQMMSWDHFLGGIPGSRFELGLCWEPTNDGLERRTALVQLKVKSSERQVHVRFPSWSWLGWRGALDLTIDDKYADAGLASAVDVYVLRNDPLRLVLARRLFADHPGQAHPSLAHRTSAISLEVIRSSYPRLKLEDVPDDQLLVFWGESARFRVSKPIMSTRSWHPRDGPLHQRRKQRCRQKLLDLDGNIAGETGPCLESQDAGAIGDKEYEFIVIAERTAPPDFEKQRIALQVERRPDGVAYRVNIAEISQGAWEKATKSHGLIVLGSEI